MTKKLTVILVIPGSGRQASRETAFIHALVQEGLLSNIKNLRETIQRPDELIQVIRFHGLGATPSPSLLSNPLEFFTTLGQNLGQFVTSIGLDENVTQAITEIQNLITQEQATEIKVAMIGFSRGGLQIVAVANELEKMHTYSGKKITTKLLLIDPAGGIVDNFAQSQHQYNYYSIPPEDQAIFIFLNDLNPSIQARSLRDFYAEDFANKKVVAFILPDLHHMHGENAIESDLDIESPLYLLLYCTRLFLQDFMASKPLTLQALQATPSAEAIKNYLSHHREEISRINTQGPSAPWRRFGQQFTNVKDITTTSSHDTLHNFLHQQLAKIMPPN
jgi:hypothetical protein